MTDLDCTIANAVYSATPGLRFRATWEAREFIVWRFLRNKVIWSRYGHQTIR
jgi:hypothetical protein